MTPPAGTTRTCLIYRETVSKVSVKTQQIAPKKYSDFKVKTSSVCVKKKKKEKSANHIAACGRRLSKLKLLRRTTISFFILIRGPSCRDPSALRAAHRRAIKRIKINYGGAVARRRRADLSSVWRNELVGPTEEPQRRIISSTNQREAPLSSSSSAATASRAAETLAVPFSHVTKCYARGVRLFAAAIYFSRNVCDRDTSPPSGK